MWDERYSSEEYVYGKEPNEFLVAMKSHIPKGRVLCIGEGEGRNAVYLAQQGYEVTGVDASSVGLAKAQRLAKERDVDVSIVVKDLAHFDFGNNAWDGIVSIFCHLPPDIRAAVHAKAVDSLRPNGVFLLEAYTPKQLQFKTGGPPTAELMLDLETAKKELAGLEFIHAEELERDVHEGQFHNGRAAVVQLIGVKR
jgi:SAM-dependent methyltransferase